VDAAETLHGETVRDPYRWLEDGDRADTRDWTARQNALTESCLAAVPGRERLRRRLDELLSIGALSVPEPVAGRYFYQRRDGRQNQPVLYVRHGARGEDRPLLDPNALDSAGTIALDWYYPSEDGRLLAYGLSENGSEQSVLHVLEVDSGALLPDRVPHTRAAELAWLPDGTGFYYTRYPAPGDVPEGEEHYHRAVFFHRLGTDPAADPLVFRPAEKEHWPGVGLSPDGRWLVLEVARTFDQTDLYLRTSPPARRRCRWRRTCRRPSAGRSLTGGSSSGPISTPRPIASTRWTRSGPVARPGGRSCLPGRRRCWSRPASRATGWP
jgi:prolyl oligopeptidase